MKEDRMLAEVGRLSVDPEEEPAVELEGKTGVWRIYAPHNQHLWRVIDPRGHLRGSYRDAEVIATHMAMVMENSDTLTEQALDLDDQNKAMIRRATTGEGHPTRFQSVPEMLIAQQRQRMDELEVRILRARDLCRCYDEPLNTCCIRLGRMVLRELAEPDEEKTDGS